MSDKIQVRRGTEAQLAAITLSSGEPGYTTDRKRWFVGTGGANMLIGGPYDTHSSIRAFQSASQTLTSGVATKVLFQVVEFDRLAEYNTSLSRFTALEIGVYLVTSYIYCSGPLAGDYLDLKVYKNGVEARRPSLSTAGGTASQAFGGTIQISLGVGDYIEIYASEPRDFTTISGTQYTFLEVCRIA